MTEPQSGRTKRRRSAATPTGKPPRPRFAVAALRRQVGETVFERGEDYFQEGAVALLVVEAKRVVAQVAGTHDYRTEVVARGETIGGRCSCPAFADWGVCKHMVAVALAANEADGDPAGDGGALARIRAHLATKSIEALVETIVGLAENDPVLLRTLDMAAVGAQADDGTVRARLRKAIDGATRIRGFVEYRDAGGWAGGVDDALDAVAELIPNGRAALAMELAEHALDGIEEALGSIDDSDGHGTALMARVEEIHLAAAQAAKPDPVELAHTLFSREIDGEYDTFTGAAERYAEVLGEAGLSEYRRLAAAAWEKVPARTGRSKDEGAYRDDRLMAILDVFAAREGDVDAQIALRAKNLSSAWRYVQLVSFCREQGREAEALRRAEEGLWLFEDDRTDERLVVLAVELLRAAGRKGDAEAQLWRAFEKAPSLRLYEHLRKLGGAAARDRALAWLRPGRGDPRGGPWGRPADLLVEILTREKMFDAAWQAVREHQASEYTMAALVRASEKTHPGEALAFYAKQVERFAGSGGNSGYAEAVKLIVRMAALRSASEQAAYVAVLKERHARKRNFMKLLG